MLPIALLFIGLLLVLTEFFLPGAIMGVLGGISIVTAIVLFAQDHELIYTLLFVGITIAAVYGIIRFALWKIVHAKMGESIYLKSDQAGFQASKFDKHAIGKKGVVISDLKPGGYIMVDGDQHQAISISGYIPKGEEVIVLSGQEESLMVKSIQEEN